MDDHINLGSLTSQRVPNGVARWQFLCAVQDSSRDPTATRKIAVDVALEIQLKEAAIAMCRFEQATGSHVLRDTCRFDP
jgi:hypothetical protein